MKKILLLMLAFCVIMPLMFSCGDGETEQGGNDGGDTPPADVVGSGGDDGEQPGEEPTEEAIDYTAGVPVEDFGGYNFRIINTDNEAMTWILTILTAEQEDGDTMNDAVYRRNRTVEEKYNITISETLVNGKSDILSAARRSITAGSNDYDLVMNEGAENMTLAQAGALTEVNGIASMDLTKPYYDHNMIRDLSLQNKLYFVAGDFSFAHYSSTLALFFNKKIVEDAALEDPYNLVKTGAWTYDKFAELARQAVSDINGDGILDRYDRFGYMGVGFVMYPAFLIGSGESFITKDANDDPVINLGNSRFIDAYNKMIDLFESEEFIFDIDKAPSAGGDHELNNTMFPGNQSLFWSELMNWSKILREMDSDFGILPHPKYEANQENYSTLTFGMFMGVPVTVESAEKTGLIIEALCAESLQSVKSAYYDTMLKTKISRDDESGEMLDIIFENRSYELANAYWYSQAYDPIVSRASNSDRNIASFLESQTDRIITAIQKTVDGLNSLS